MKTGENDIIKDKINEDNENNIIDERANNTLNDKINDINGENNKFELKSENIYNDLEKFIEKNIENKINNLLETLPNNVKNIKDNNNFYDLSLRELYKNTLQTIIDIINDISNAYSNEYIDNNTILQKFSTSFIDNYKANAKEFFNMYVDNQVGRLSSLFGKELILGSFIQKILPIGILMSYFLFNKKIFSKLFILFGAIGTITIILSGERAAFILWFFFLFLSIFLLQIKFKYKAILFFFFIFFLIFSVLFNKSIKDRFIYQLQEQIKFGENQEIKFFSRGHSNHINSSIKMLKDNVFFGQGPNIFRIKCSNPKFFVKDGCTTHPHNIYFQLLA